MDVVQHVFIEFQFNVLGKTPIFSIKSIKILLKIVGVALAIGLAGGSCRFLRTRRFFDSLESLERSSSEPSDSLALLRLIDLLWV